MRRIEPPEPSPSTHQPERRYAGRSHQNQMPLMTENTRAQMEISV